MTDRKKCPSCGKVKNILNGFGVRFKHLAVDAEGQVVQSWCVTCRRGQAGSKPKYIPVSEMGLAVITPLYRQYYPNDKGNGRPGGAWSRPINFMRTKLAKKLGE